jgi:hypothetical protein
MKMCKIRHKIKHRITKKDKNILRDTNEMKKLKLRLINSKIIKNDEEKINLGKILKVEEGEDLVS